MAQFDCPEIKELPISNIPEHIALLYHLLHYLSPSAYLDV